MADKTRVEIFRVVMPQHYTTSQPRRSRRQNSYNSGEWFNTK